MPYWLNVLPVFAKEIAGGGADHVPKESGLFGARLADAWLCDLHGVSEEVLGPAWHGACPYSAVSMILCATPPPRPLSAHVQNTS